MKEVIAKTVRCLMPFIRDSAIRRQLPGSGRGQTECEGVGGARQSEGLFYISLAHGSFTTVPNFQHSFNRKLKLGKFYCM